MSIYCCLPAANIYDNQQRVAAHRHTPCAREELCKLQELVPRLRELGVMQILCSDLDGQSGAALGRRLNVPVIEWESLRRRNWGKLHGTARYKSEAVLDGIIDATVPLKGGDSYASFNKRCSASLAKLAKLEGTMLLLVDAEVLTKLTGASGARRYHVYEVELREQPNEATPISKQAASG